MDDLISRQAAIDALEKVADMFPWKVPGNRDTYDRYNEAWNDSIGRAEMEIENMPSAQPERKTGKWIQNDNGTYSCSICQSWIPEEQHYYARYCLYCGADMGE